MNLEQGQLYFYMVSFNETINPELNIVILSRFELFRYFIHL